MSKELKIFSEEESLRVRSRPASWGFGIVLIAFLGGMLWMVYRSVSDKDVTRAEIVRLFAFGLASVLVFGWLIFMAIGHRELIADQWGLVYTLKILFIPVWKRSIPRREIRGIKTVFIEGASGEGGSTTLEVQSVTRKHRFFALPTGDELTEVVTRLKQIQKDA